MRSTIRVFEHERIRVGQLVRTTTDEPRALTQNEFDELVRFDERRLDRIFELGHRSLKFRHYVGFIQVGNLGIEILPKVDRGQVNAEDRGRWHGVLLNMLRATRRLPITRSSSASTESERGDLLDAFVGWFLCELEHLARQGLAKSYRLEERNQGSFSGRLLVREQIRHNIVHAERFYVERTVYDIDNLHNQVLRAALEILGTTALSSPTESHRRSVLAWFEQVEHRRFRVADLSRITLSRKTERYRLALDIAGLILRNHSPSLRSGGSDLLAFVFDMNALWESYVAVLLRRALGRDVEVRTQESRCFWAAKRHRGYVRPDIVLRRRGESRPFAILDTKWKLPQDGRPSPADLKQMFAYNEFFGAETSVLLYPAESLSQAGINGRFEHREHECRTAYLSATADDPIVAVRGLVDSLLRGEPEMGGVVDGPQFGS